MQISADLDPGSRILDPGSRIQDLGSRVWDPGSWIQDQVNKFLSLCIDVYGAMWMCLDFYTLVCIRMHLHWFVWFVLVYIDLCVLVCSYLLLICCFRFYGAI